MTKLIINFTFTGYSQSNNGAVTPTSYSPGSENAYPSGPQRVCSVPVPCILQPRVETATLPKTLRSTVQSSQQSSSSHTAKQLLNNLPVKSELESFQQTSPVKIQYQSNNFELSPCEREQISPKTLQQLELEVMETNFLNSFKQDLPQGQFSIYSSQEDFSQTE